MNQEEVVYLHCLRNNQLRVCVVLKKLIQEEEGGEEEDYLYYLRNNQFGLCLAEWKLIQEVEDVYLYYLRKNQLRVCLFKENWHKKKNKKNKTIYLSRTT